MSPLTHGSVSLREFYVEGELEPDWRRACEKQFIRHAFRPIAIEKGETRSAGWVNPRQVLDADVSLDKMKIGPAWILLALRQDRVALNARIFRARRSLALAEAARKAGKTQLSKNERLAVEDTLKLEMLKQQTPATAIIEAAWDPERAIAYVAASSESAATLFSEFFSLTFEMALVPAVAGIRATRWAEAHGLGEKLAELVPAGFGSSAGAGEMETADMFAEGDGDGAA